MEKEFVPYTEALALKELGFDEPCLFAFDNCSTPMRCSDLRTNKQKFNGVNYNSSSYTSQPSFHQVFGWFREKYQIDSWIYPNLNGLYSISNVRRGVGLGKVSEYQTYEEAELECLKKLIEIVKEK